MVCSTDLVTGVGTGEQNTRSGAGKGRSNTRVAKVAQRGDDVGNRLLLTEASFGSGQKKGGKSKFGVHGDDYQAVFSDLTGDKAG